MISYRGPPYVQCPDCIALRNENVQFFPVKLGSEQVLWLCKNWELCLFPYSGGELEVQRHIVPRSCVDPTLIADTIPVPLDDKPVIVSNGDQTIFDNSIQTTFYDTPTAVSMPVTENPPKDNYIPPVSVTQNNEFVDDFSMAPLGENFTHPDNNIRPVRSFEYPSSVEQPFDGSMQPISENVSGKTWECDEIVLDSDEIPPAAAVEEPTVIPSSSETRSTPTLDLNRTTPRSPLTVVTSKPDPFQNTSPSVIAKVSNLVNNGKKGVLTNFGGQSFAQIANAVRTNVVMKPKQSTKEKSVQPSDDGQSELAGDSASASSPSKAAKSAVPVPPMMDKIFLRRSNLSNLILNSLSSTKAKSSDTSASQSPTVSMLNKNKLVSKSSLLAGSAFPGYNQKPTNTSRSSQSALASVSSIASRKLQKIRNDYFSPYGANSKSAAQPSNVPAQRVSVAPRPINAASQPVVSSNGATVSSVKQSNLSVVSTSQPVTINESSNEIIDLDLSGLEIPDTMQSQTLFNDLDQHFDFLQQPAFDGDTGIDPDLRFSL